MTNVYMKEIEDWSEIWGTKPPCDLSLEDIIKLDRYLWKEAVSRGDLATIKMFIDYERHLRAKQGL